jgi:hypothetical protein
MSFDPNNYEPKEQKRRNIRNLEKPGTYMLGISKVQDHGETRNGKPYTNFRFVVLDGPEKGASFFDKVFRNEEAWQRLAALMRAVRNTNRFDPYDDDAMERAFLGRAFMCDVRVERSETNGKNYARAAFPLTDYSENELATMREWEKKFLDREARQQAAGGGSSYGGGGGGGRRSAPSDYREDGANYGDGEDYGSGSSGGGAPSSWGDDDIPF